jgi:uncharacterized protein (TIGR00290 family)
MLPNKRRVLLSWSSGKDSAWCLHVLNRQEDVEVVGLLTTFNESVDRVAMHAVRRQLVAAQAESIGLPLIPVMLPWPCSNDDYEAAMKKALREVCDQLDVRTIAFGDLFLEDIRAYREERMAAWDAEAIFPIWNSATSQLAARMIDAGLRAYLTCVDPRQCPAEFAGRLYDKNMLSDLPESVDPCGENGEFHSFVFDGPMFGNAIDVNVGETIERDGFVFADIVPVS